MGYRRPKRLALRPPKVVREMSDASFKFPILFYSIAPILPPLLPHPLNSHAAIHNAARFRGVKMGAAVPLSVGKAIFFGKSLNISEEKTAAKNKK